MKITNTKFRLSTLAVAASLIASALVPTAQAAEVGDAVVLAQVPAPGYPEGIVVNPLLTYVTGAATFGTAGNGIPSRVWAYGPNGTLVKTIDVVGEDLNQEHANSCAAADAKNRLYVLNSQLGVLRFTASQPHQSNWGAPIPDLPACNAVAEGTACSPVPVNTPPLANDLAFDRAGNLYVTDSLQATIWKYPRTGGSPSIWFQDIRLAPGMAEGSIGVNGIRLSPDGRTVYVSVSIDGNNQGHIYTLPLVNKPKAASLKLFHTFAPGDIPDGFAFGETGTLYVTDATPYSSGVIGLDAAGNEVLRLENPQQTPLTPYDSPANLAFDGEGSILLTNHAFATGGEMPGQFQVIKTYVNDTGAELFKPVIP